FDGASFRREAEASNSAAKWCDPSVALAAEVEPVARLRHRRANRLAWNSMHRIDDAGRVALAVCLLFDARTDVLMRELWSRLEDVGAATLATHTHRRHHPHLSYAVLRSWELARVQETLAALPA